MALSVLRLPAAGQHGPPEKKRVMHHRAATQTRIYTSRLSPLAEPPNRAATMSRPKKPMLPQLRPPIMTRTRAILSSIFMGETSRNHPLGSPWNVEAGLRFSPGSQP